MDFWLPRRFGSVVNNIKVDGFTESLNSLGRVQLSAHEKDLPPSY